LNVEKAILAGHSLAGVELTHFAATYPTRVEKLIYLDALDDRRGESAIMEQNPLSHVQIQREESPAPRTLEEYIANVKREVPEFAAIWSEVWDEEISHNVKVNEEGIVVDKMPASVETMLVDNLIKDYAPKRVNAAIPILFFTGNRRRKRFDGYTEEQKAAYEKFDREVREPFFWSIVSEFQGRFPHAQVIVIPGGHHYCFMAQEELVYGEMRKFLLE
jgi:pimeloyl-ACP methyl ester carboxylesterase